MSRFLIILLGMVALSVLARFCLHTYMPRIEDDLAARTQQALTEQGKHFVQVGIDGRDIYLSGIAPNKEEIEQAVEISGGVFGVRRVVDQLDLSTTIENLEPQSLTSENDVAEPMADIVQPAFQNLESQSITRYLVAEPQSLNAQPATVFPVAESPYRTDFSYKNGRIVLTGAVADETSHLWLLNRAQEIFGKDNVDDQLRISYGAPQGWDNTVETALSNLVMFSKAEAVIVDHTLTLSGISSSAALMARVEADVNAGIGPSYVAKFEIETDELLPENISKESPALVASTETKMSKPEVPCQQQFDLVLDGKRILFDTNKAVIKLRSHAVLDQLVTIAKTCSKLSIEVGGHTDSRGLRAHNQLLSELRAKAVVAYLKKHGINSNKLTAKGYGELMPIADNNTVKGLARNRRIEFKVGEK